MLLAIFFISAVNLSLLFPNASPITLLNCDFKTLILLEIKERIIEFDEEVEVGPVSGLPFRKLTAKEFYKNEYARRMIWGRLLKSRDTSRLRFPPEVDAHQDTLYNLKLIACLKRPSVYLIDTPMYFYLQRSDSLFKKRSYEEMIEIADWYVKNERESLRQKGGEWRGLLLFHMISTVLSCRYQADLLDNRELVRHTDALLRTMMADMLRDKSISLKDKSTRAAMILFPYLYRCFREHNGTAIRVK